MYLIYWFSARSSRRSRRDSRGFTRHIVRIYAEISGMEENTQVRWTILLEPYIRKLAHMTEYAILFILLYLAVRIYFSSFVMRSFISILICALYACTDEFHQMFVSGRSGKPFDVLIDMTGAVIALIICRILKFLPKRVE